MVKNARASLTLEFHLDFFSLHQHLEFFELIKILKLNPSTNEKRPTDLSRQESFFERILLNTMIVFN